MISNNQVSIIIPTVNASAELDLAITSIRKNSVLEYELIIVVDPDLKTGKFDAEILSICKKHKLTPIKNDQNLGPYGSWNKGATQAKYQLLIFATDDQYFAPSWDLKLVESWKQKRLVAGRLVEPGIIPVYKDNLRADFGTTPAEFRAQEFEDWCSNRKERGLKQGGFFIPMLQSRVDFESLGRYPTAGQFGTSAAISNDYLYIQNALKKGYEFVTAQESYSYHFQASSWKKKSQNPTIAAIILTKNEEQDLPKTLDSLGWADQVIVIDSGSTDKTKDIAKRSGATIYTNSFLDYASQRNFALSKTQSFDWVLMIDADETVESELAKELRSFAQDIYLDGVYIPRKNYIFGHFIAHSDWYPDERLVFFRPKLAKYCGEVHERVEFIRGNGATVHAQAHLIHHNYDNLSEFLTKNLLDYPLSYAKTLDQAKLKFTPLDLLAKPIAEFLRRFFLAKGYLDGLYGLILSLLMAAQTLVAYCYLWELQGKREDLSLRETKQIFAELAKKGVEIQYWLSTMQIDASHGISRLFHRLKRKAITLKKSL